MQKKKFDKYAENNQDWVEEWLEFQDQVVSTTDCTGLIPTMPKTNAQAEAYTKLYPIPNQEPQAHRSNY